MSRAAVIAAALALVTWEASAQSGSLRWNRLDVVATLDAAGGLEIQETHDITVSGDVRYIARSLNFAADQRAIVHRVASVDMLGRVTELPEVDDPKKPSYRHYLWGVHIVIRGEDDPWFDERTRLHYVVAYRLTNALTPAWDLRAGPKALVADTFLRSPLERVFEVVAGWREAAEDPQHLYRLEHDLVFPSSDSADGLGELNYHFGHDKAWVLLDANKPLGVAEENVSYRVQRLLRHVGTGVPEDVRPSNAAWRLAALLGPPLGGLALVLFFLLVDRVLRPGPSGNRNLFKEKIGDLFPDLAGAAFGSHRMPPTLGRFVGMQIARRRMSMSLDKDGDAENPPFVTLRLNVDRATLPPFERDVVQEIFGSQNSVSTEQMQRRLKKPDLDLDETIAQVFARHARAAGGVAPGRRRMWFAFQAILLVAGIGLMVQSIIEHNGADPLPLVMMIFPGYLLASILPSGGSIRRASAGWILIATVLVGAIMGLITLAPNRPLDSQSAMGALLLGLAFSAQYLSRVPKRRAADAGFDAAARWAIAELKKPHPDLLDEWVDALEAMGAGASVERWKAKQGANAGADGASFDPSTGEAISIPSGPRFTGEPKRPGLLPEDWDDGFLSYLADDEEEDDDER